MNTKRNWPENLPNSRLLTLGGGELLYLPHWVQLQKQKLDKHYALVRENRPLAIRSFLSSAHARIAVISGHEHPEMGRRASILENKKPGTGIAELLSRDSQIFHGHPGGTIDAFVSIGSALSNQLARALDGHAETLERTRKPVFGSLVTEFDRLSKPIVSYIETQRVSEPFRVLVKEGTRKQIPVFEPEVHNGILENDVLVIKVLRSRGGAPSILRIEGLGPAATVYGFRLLLENRGILSELAQYAAKWDSFEAVIVVKNVEVKKDRRRRKSMVANGPLDIIGCWPIDGTEVDRHVLRAAYASLPSFVPESEKILDFPAVRREAPLALDVRADYSRGDKYVGALLQGVRPLLKEEDMGGEKFVPTIDKIISDVSKKTIDKFKEQSAARGLSDEEGSEIFRQGMSFACEVFDARIERGMTSEEVKQKIQGLAKKEGAVFESQPKPRRSLKAPDISEIPLWQGRKKDGMPLEFIKEHYGQWLSAFGAEEDRVFQDQIRGHDAKLMEGLRSQLHEEGKRNQPEDGKKRTVSSFIRPKSTRVDLELENINAEYLRNADRLAVAARSRRRKLKK